jgi:hypothetical protein
VRSPNCPNANFCCCAGFWLCWFLDAGNHETLHTPNEPASKKRQGTKSREAGDCRAARTMGITCRQRARRWRPGQHCLHAGKLRRSARYLGGKTEFIDGRLVDRWMVSVRAAASRTAESFHNFNVLA